MTFLLATLLSPLIALVITIIVVSIAKSRRLSKPTLKSLFFFTLLSAVAGAITTLTMTIVWMMSYEYSTGFGAGNAPLGWIFFYGPLGVACGQLFALTVWWFKKPVAERGENTG